MGKDFEAVEAGALDRYERRAPSRRKFAVRDYDAGRATLAAANYQSKTSLQSEQQSRHVQLVRYVLYSFWQNEPNLRSAMHKKVLANSLLESKVVELRIVDRASDSTIGRALKTTFSRPIADSAGSSRPRPTARS